MYIPAQKQQSNNKASTSGKSIDQIVGDKKNPVNSKIEETIRFYTYIRDKYAKVGSFVYDSSPKHETHLPPMDNNLDYQNYLNESESANITFESALLMESKLAKAKGIYFDRYIFKKLRSGMRVNSDFLKYVIEKHGKLASYQRNFLDHGIVSFGITSADVDRFYATKRPTFFEAALMAKDVYDNPENTRELQGGWRASRREIPGVIYMNNEIGFQSRLYEKLNKNGGVIAYAYVSRGSDELIDFKDNFQQGSPSNLIFSSAQYNLSMDNAKLISNNLGDAELTMVGHSLGGGLAHANSVVTGRESIGFNPAGLSYFTNSFEYSPHPLSNRGKDASSIIVEGEGLNVLNTFTTVFGAGVNKGDEYKLENGDPSTVPLWMVNPVLGAAVDFNNGLNRHGMDTVLDLMEKNSWKK
ncbi:hypothetical protein [Aquimarina longa]|uniref:hypothetical protein n=1 Tax=Aquimarina longa TaxID=1080221 RepID=UPI000783B56A|nr:hypothetical protein [Aquimarina longa]